MNRILADTQRMLLCMVCLLLLGACRSPAALVADNTAGSELLATSGRAGLRYELYRLPAGNTTDKTCCTAYSIRVVNTADNTSPLRRLCHDLQQYNTYYEYLLNGAVNDIQLVCGTEIQYPVSYSFENNYNAFPFETINVGYKCAVRRSRKRALRMVYTDRVFAQDTIVFYLNPNKL